MLNTLKLRQFRCFEAATCTFGPDVTLFLGENAQGKTSILEAICIGLRLQSPRASSLGDAIRFGQDAFALTLGLEEAELQLGFSKGRRKLVVDGSTMRTSGEYLSQSMLVVWIANDDLALVRGGADGRRRYLDFMAGQLFLDYRPALKNYERALKARNFLLKRDAQPNWRQIDAYTPILVESAAVITRLRRDLIERLQPKAAQSQIDIASSNEELTLEYKSARGADLETALMEARAEESRRRSTAAGPHRDDLILKLHGMPAAQFASEGQQRTVALALKLGQARLFQEFARRSPILLLDDIFGELDPNRRNALMRGLPAGSQKLITTTFLDWWDERGKPVGYRVRSGTLEALTENK